MQRNARKDWYDANEKDRKHHTMDKPGSCRLLPLLWSLRKLFQGYRIQMECTEKPVLLAEQEKPEEELYQGRFL